MKKYLYAFMGLITLGIVACDDDNLPNPAPPVNSQDVILSNVTLENALLYDEYDLASLNANDELIYVASILPELADGYSYKANVEISIDDFEHYTNVPAIMVDETLDNNDFPAWKMFINPDALQGAIYSGISKTGQPLELQVRYQIMTVKGNQTAYIGNPDNDQNFYGPFKINVIPYEMTLVIEENYYLIGSMQGWSLANGIKFNHEGDDQYANPIFTLEVTITETQASSLDDNGWWWKIIPESTYSAQDWNGTVIGVTVDGSTDIDGILIDNNAQSGRMAEAGTYILTINMEEMIYNFAPVVEFLYVPGATNGWSFTTLLPSNGTGANYSGYVGVTGGLKFTTDTSWADDATFGAGDEAGVLTNPGSDITEDPNGLYYFNVDLENMTYSSTLIETIGVIGDGTPGGWDSDTALEPNDDFTIWSGVVNFTTGKFKFRMNNAWDLNLGGYELNLTQDGSDIPTPGEGKYEVILNLGTYPYQCRLIAQ